MKNTLPYSFIAIEGNIGAGKTTLCEMLHKDYGAQLILEQFTDNPFLPYFYKNPERYAFQVELFFMTERHKQLQEQLSQPSLFDDLVISDYFFIKTLLFAKNNLIDEEYRLFQRLFNVLNTTFKKPEILFYLHRSVDDLLKNIENRGRAYEKEIKPDYLLSIQNSYFDYFKTIRDMPVVIVDTEGLKFWNDKNAYQKLVELLQSKEYKNGLQYVEI